MKSKVLIIKNIPREDPGLLEIVLKEHSILFDKIEPAFTEQITNIDKYRAVIVLGGPASANDTDKRMLFELTLIRNVVESGIPYLGICLGLQTLVKANGGEVLKCQVPEIGFRDHSGHQFSIDLTTEGRNDRLFQNLPDTLNVFQLHGETVIPTNKMKLLGTGRSCKNQIVKIGPVAYGIQCHFEITPELLEIWMNEDDDLCKYDKKMLRDDLKKLGDQYCQTGRRLFSNFLSIAGLN